MTLTPRRREFLEAIRESYRKTGEPLHYKDVARLLGVSKWTAYDMVRELARSGYITISYTKDKDSGRAGRSRISIVPADFEKTARPSNLNRIRELLHLIAHGHDEDGRVADLLEQSASCHSRELFCTYIITVMMLLTEGVLPKGLVNLLESLLIASRPELGLVTAIGLLLGVIIHTGIRTEIVTELQEDVAYFQQCIGEISDEERYSIRSFWQQALLNCRAES